MATIEKRKSEGGVTFRVKVRLKGYPVQTATFQRLTDARRWAQQTESAIQEGRHFKTREAKRHTLAELIDRYIESVLPHKKSAHEQKRHLLWWKEELGSYTLADITSARISEKRDVLLAGTTVRKELRSPATANRYLAALSHVFTVGAKEWGWVESNPLSNVRKLKEPRGRIRFLSDEERQVLLKVCMESSNSFLYLIVVVALSTGARRGEILNLRWQDIDFKRSVITLHETKNSERRVLPLVGHACQLMLAHQKVRRIDSDFVFSAQRGDKPINIRDAWETAIEKANLEDFRFHDLRHSAASYLAMNGASLAEIAEVLGHKTLQMVKRYAHLSEAHTSKVVESMNKKVFG